MAAHLLFYYQGKTSFYSKINASGDPGEAASKSVLLVQQH